MSFGLGLVRGGLAGWCRAGAKQAGVHESATEVLSFVCPSELQVSLPLIVLPLEAPAITANFRPPNPPRKCVKRAPFVKLAFLQQKGAFFGPKRAIFFDDFALQKNRCYERPYWGDIR